MVKLSYCIVALSYNKMTNLSMIGFTSSGMSHGVLDNCSKTSVSSGSTFHVFHVVFLPTKLDTVCYMHILHVYVVQ